MASEPHTVFLVVHQGLIARFLLRSDVLATLKRAGLRIVILAPNADEPYMAAEFADPPQVVVERLVTEYSGDLPRFANAMNRIRSFGMAHGQQSPALAYKYELFRLAYSKQKPVSAFLINLGVKLAQRSSLVRRLVLSLESRLFSPRPHRALFERYRPTLVVTTSLGWAVPDAVLMREAQANGARTAAIISSWDHPTSKGYRAVSPDRVLVWSERMARRVARFHDFPPERIRVVGVPHFDHYVREDKLFSRTELCTRLGLDPERRIVLLAIGAPPEHQLSVNVARALAQAIRDDRLRAPAQLVIRVHPNYLKPLAGYLAPTAWELSDFERIRDEFPSVHVNIPEILSRRLACDVSASDHQLLGSLVKNCDVLVNAFSTTTLEACLCDRPVVIVTSYAYLVDGDRREDGAAMPRSYEAYEHQRPVLEHGAAHVAHSLHETVDAVSTYLLHSELDAEARRAVAWSECGPMDGQSGERAARELITMTGGPLPELEPENQFSPARRGSDAPASLAPD